MVSPGKRQGLPMRFFQEMTQTLREGWHWGTAHLRRLHVGNTIPRYVPPHLRPNSHDTHLEPSRMKAVQGIVTGLVLVAPFWGMIAWMVWLLFN